MGLCLSKGCSGGPYDQRYLDDGFCTPEAASSQYESPDGSSGRYSFAFDTPRISADIGDFGALGSLFFRRCRSRSRDGTANFVTPFDMFIGGVSGRSRVHHVNQMCGELSFTSYLSSPLLKGFDVHAMEAIAKSYAESAAKAAARDAFVFLEENDASLSFTPISPNRLLVREGDEEEESDMVKSVVSEESDVTRSRSPGTSDRWESILHAVEARAKAKGRRKRRPAAKEIARKEPSFKKSVRFKLNESEEDFHKLDKPSSWSDNQQFNDSEETLVESHLMGEDRDNVTDYWDRKEQVDCKPLSSLFHKKKCRKHNYPQHSEGHCRDVYGGAPYVPPWNTLIRNRVSEVGVRLPSCESESSSQPSFTSQYETGAFRSSGPADDLNDCSFRTTSSGLDAYEDFGNSSRHCGILDGGGKINPHVRPSRAMVSLAESLEHDAKVYNTSERSRIGKVPKPISLGSVVMDGQIVNDTRTEVSCPNQVDGGEESDVPEVEFSFHTANFSFTSDNSTVAEHEQSFTFPCLVSQSYPEYSPFSRTSSGIWRDLPVYGEFNAGETEQDKDVARELDHAVSNPVEVEPNPPIPVSTRVFTAPTPIVPTFPTYESRDNRRGLSRKLKLYSLERASIAAGVKRWKDHPRHRRKHRKDENEGDSSSDLFEIETMSGTNAMGSSRTPPSTPMKALLMSNGTFDLKELGNSAFHLNRRRSKRDLAKEPCDGEKKTRNTGKCSDTVKAAIGAGPALKGLPSINFRGKVFLKLGLLRRNKFTYRDHSEFDSHRSSEHSGSEYLENEPPTKSDRGVVQQVMTEWYCLPTIQRVAPSHSHDRKPSAAKDRVQLEGRTTFAVKN